MQRTEIATLGEFGLIKHLTEDIKLQHSSSKYGIGDDAAVLSYDSKMTLVTTDMLLEGIHFDLTYFPLKHLGYKAAVVNFSDIYAMSGGEKQRVYIAIYLSFRPEIIMLDEPTSALDSRNTIDVIENIISFCRGNSSTVIIVSHERWCERACF